MRVAPFGCFQKCAFDVVSVSGGCGLGHFRETRLRRVESIPHLIMLRVRVQERSDQIRLSEGGNIT